MAASKAAHSAASMDASSVESTVGETDETMAVVLVVWWGGKMAAWMASSWAARLVGELEKLAVAYLAAQTA